MTKRNFSHALTAEVKKIFEKSLRRVKPREVIGSSAATTGITHHCSPRNEAYGRGGGVGRGLDGGLDLGVGLGLGVDVGVGVGVGVGVAVAVGVGVGVGVPPAGARMATVMGDPVLKKPTVALAVCGG